MIREFTDTGWEALTTSASGIGSAHGQTAASWVDIDDAATARRLLAGLEENDPEILDSLPAPPTGEYADDYSPCQLFRDLDVPGDAETDDMELWHAYADAFHSAVCDAIEQRCREMPS